MLWQVYDALTCQVLVLRGKDSDLLDIETARGMVERGPKARLVEFEGVGHAPTLIHADQIAPVHEFLLA
jgi:pimeloyl-ACP methyl ester carboxylesterase